MTDWLVSTTADEGAGFRPSPGRSSASIADTIRTAFRRLEPLYPQLASAPGDTDGIPVVTFRFDQRSAHWVVILQGSGGNYGLAGTVQFVSTDSPVQLSSLLPAALGVVARDGQFTPGSRVPGRRARTVAAPAELGGDLARLTRLGGTRRVARLDVPTGLVPARLQDLAALLPESVARGYTWSTSLATGRVEDDEFVITGEWPSELRSRHPAEHERLSPWLAQDAPADAEEPSPALVWALSEAADGRYPGRDSLAGDLPAWLAELERARVKALHPLSLAEVATRLRRNPQRVDVALEFADTQPEPVKALAGIAREAPGALGPLLGELALSASSTTNREFLTHFTDVLGADPTAVLLAAAQRINAAPAGQRSRARWRVVTALQAVMKPDSQPRILPDWTQRHAFKLLTFASTPDFAGTVARAAIRRRRLLLLAVFALVAALALGVTVGLLWP